jgi:hypothetical protein
MKCNFEDCKTRASYGMVLGKATHCAKHKKSEMFDVINKTCSEKDCKKQPTYGLIHKKPTHCFKHKISEMFDVVSKTCSEKDCKTQPNYGLVWQKATHCGKHKMPKMSLALKPKCLKCDNYAFYGEEKVSFCEEHKSPTDKDLIRTVCIVCYDKLTPDKVFDNKCKDCNSKWKNGQHYEYDVINYVLKGNFEYTHNKVVKQKDCKSTGSRPDFVLRNISPLFNVIIEVDEDQHSGYKKMCDTSVHKELARMISIYENDFGGNPLIIIRFNPDKYKSKNPHSMVDRFRTLKNMLYSLSNKTTVLSNLTCYYLYYDFFDTITESPIVYKIEDKVLKITHKHPKIKDTEFVIKL